MKNLTLITFLFVLSILITSCSVQPQKTVPEEFKVGQTHYHKLCGNCHGQDAMGGNRAPKLIQEIYSSNAYSDEKISKIILNGSNSGAMPSLKHKISDEEIKEIIKYIRHSQSSAGLGS
jgi:cytochrome c553